MQRMVYRVCVLIFFLTGCSNLPSPTQTGVQLTSTAILTGQPPYPTMSGVPSKTATPTTSPLKTREPITTETARPISSPAPILTSFVWLGEPSNVPRSTFEVRFHPDGELYVGDWVSIEVIAPDGFSATGFSVTVELDGMADRELGSAGFGVYGLGGQIEAVLPWVWNTASAQAGGHDLEFTIKPYGPTWTETVFLDPHGQLPPDEQRAHWAQAESDCCLVHYITGTAAERDLVELLKMFDAQSEDASQRMGAALPRPLDVTLLPRVIGNGGFAEGGISISYLDRNHAQGDTATIFHHELIHILDARLGGDYRPPLFVEGLAVYLSGGHYKPEPLMPRAAGLLQPEEGCVPINYDQNDQPSPTLTQTALPVESQKPCRLGLYISLALLVKDFYNQQHEIGYLEAASLIEYMVTTWGWKSYSAFYRDIHLPKGAPAVGATAAHQALDAVNDTLQRHFGLDLPALEKQYIQALENQPLESRWLKDLYVDLVIHDRGRAYQKFYDPGAYFLEAWLPDAKLMRERGIVADYLRRPLMPDNYALETLLQAGEERLLAGDLSQTNRLGEAATSILFAWPEQGARVFQLNPLAADYYALVELILGGSWLGADRLQKEGDQAAYHGRFQPQRIQVYQSKATVWASTVNGPNLIELFFLKLGGFWKILTSS